MFKPLERKKSQDQRHFLVIDDDFVLEFLVGFKISFVSLF